MVRLCLYVFALLGLTIGDAQAFATKSNNPNPGNTVTPPASTPSTPGPAPTVIRARWEASQRDGAKWSQYVFDQLPILGRDLLERVPTDIANFCPNYTNLSSMDRRNFWVYLVSAMTELESGHRPEVSFQENFNDSQGRPVVSRGLLQISIESGNGYGCNFRSEQELHDPYRNLSCGLRILNRWVGNDGLVSGFSRSWLGGARYWAVLRKESSLSNIRSWVRNQSICLIR